MIKDYLSLSEELQGVGHLYPVSVLHWHEFSEVARKYLLYSYDFLKYRCQLDESVKLLDYLMALVIFQEPKDLAEERMLEFSQMLSLSFQEPVHPYFHPQTKQWVFAIGGEASDRYLTRDNFDDYRRIVMRQNLLFEPLVAPNEFSQRTIDDAIERMSRRSPESDLEAMLALVSVIKGISPDQFKNYSYYQLRIDFEMAQRLEYNRFIHLYRSQGAKVEGLNLAGKLESLENPYSFERLFKKVDVAKENEFQKMLS